MLGLWRNRLTLYLEEFQAADRATSLDLALESRAATRARLEHLRSAYQAQSQLVTQLLAPLAMARLPLPQPSLTAVETVLPVTQDLHSYYSNLHRDWSWGGVENAAAHELVNRALGEHDAQRLLVLGAGGCRLAYDLHQSSSRSITVALDINPLLLLAAARIVRGETVDLVEFPIAPRTAADVAVRRQLRAPAAVRSGLELLFADAWQAPFAPQTFGAVVTPWLIDIVDVDFATVALHVNRLLALGGQWVNFGSLAFPWRRPALRHSVAELQDILGECGFDVIRFTDATLPYMRSPASRHGRMEEVSVFTAVKRRRGPREAADSGSPPWLANMRLPVPVGEGIAMAAEASRIQAVLLALVDGRRSVDDLVRLVSEQGLFPRDQAHAAVRGLLERLHATGERLKVL